MSSTEAHRPARAEAAARRWFRVLESMAGTSANDEVFSVVHRRWLAAERMACRELRRRGPVARRS